MKNEWVGMKIFRYKISSSHRTTPSRPVVGGSIPSSPNMVAMPPNPNDADNGKRGGWRDGEVADVIG